MKLKRLFFFILLIQFIEGESLVDKYINGMWNLNQLILSNGVVLNIDGFLIYDDCTRELTVNTLRIVDKYQIIIINDSTIQRTGHQHFDPGDSTYWDITEIIRPINDCEIILYCPQFGIDTKLIRLIWECEPCK